MNDMNQEPSSALVLLIVHVLREHRNRWVRNDTGTWNVVCTCRELILGDIYEYIGDNGRSADLQRRHKAEVILKTVTQDCLVRKASRQIVKQLAPV